VCVTFAVQVQLLEKSESAQQSSSFCFFGGTSFFVPAKKKVFLTKINLVVCVHALILRRAEFGVARDHFSVHETAAPYLFESNFNRIGIHLLAPLRARFLGYS
jgi:hypothetical protein